jgi:hypothetical protein
VPAFFYRAYLLSISSFVTGDTRRIAASKFNRDAMRGAFYTLRVKAVIRASLVMRLHARPRSRSWNVAA